MQKVMHILKRGETTNDRAYWMSKTSAERLSAIEFLRQQYPGYEDQLSKGLCRVCNIIRKTPAGTTQKSTAEYRIFVEKILHYGCLQ